MIQHVSRMASSRWWAALAIALAIFTVARTNTVDAPADAMTFEGGAPDQSRGIDGIASPSLELSLPSAPGASVESQLDTTRYLWTLESEIRALETELAVERARAQILQESYSALEDKFLHLTAALPLLSTVAEVEQVRDPAHPAADEHGVVLAPAASRTTTRSVPVSPEGAGSQLERKPR